MKIKSLFIAALVVLSSAVSFAGKDEPKSGFAVISVKGSEVFKVIYKNEVTGKVKLNIYNASGSVIFSETQYGSDGFIRPLNFTGLASGEYTIELIDASGKKIEKVFYEPKSNIKQVHISKLSNEAGKFLLAIANTGKESINVSIYDNDNNLVHTESRIISGDFAQVYKLSNASLSYTFQVTDKSGNIKTIKF